LHQWSPLDRSLPPELQRNSGYLQLRDNEASALTLKQVVYLAIRNNPGLRADILEPLAAEQSVREANAEFDPLLTSLLDQTKAVSPTISNFGSVGQPAFSRKQYDWNFGVTKLLSLTNGTLSFDFNNTRIESNARAWTVDPSYNPSLALSISQPLLRNFGFDFATINVRLAELSQKQSQYMLEQHLSDFVLQIASDYWNVVRADQNLQVTQGALKLSQDLLNQDLAGLRLGMVARIAVQEAQAETESWRATLFAAQDTLTAARARLRQGVMLNPKHAFLAEQIEPSESPSGDGSIHLDEEQSLEAAIEYRPELGAMREAIRSMLLQVKFAENQTLPQLSVGARIGVNATAGSMQCFHFHDIPLRNCRVSAVEAGSRLPYGGIYGDALNRLWYFKFYDYAAVLNVAMPLTNDYTDAALAQARVEYDQQRLRYQEQLAQIVLDVETALSQVKTSAERARATSAASDYARAAFSAEDARYHAGVADTHELLQYQQELISTLANQVQARLDLETAKLGLKHAEGTLLDSFQINFGIEDPHRSPWYTRF
jgi:outer membrane protein TolC